MADPPRKSPGEGQNRFGDEALTIRSALQALEELIQEFGFDQFGLATEGGFWSWKQLSKAEAPENRVFTNNVVAFPVAKRPATRPFIQRIHDAKINGSISWFYDRGFALSLGDGFNGFIAKGNAESWQEAERWFHEIIKLHFPECDRTIDPSER